MATLNLLGFLFSRRGRDDDASPRWQAEAIPNARQSLGLSRWSLGALLGVAGFGMFLFAALLAIAPVLGTMVFVFLLLVFLLFKMLAWVAPGQPIWVRVLSTFIVGMCVINTGVTGMIFSSGSLPIPITDLVIYGALLCALYQVIFGKSKIHLPAGIIILGFWVIFSLAYHFQQDYRLFRMDAARDAIRMTEWLVVIPAYVATRMALQSADRGVAWFRRLLLSLGWGIGVYGLLTPVSEYLYRFSPAFSGGKNYSPLLGSYVNWPMAGLVAVFSVLIYRWVYPQPKPLRVNLFHILVAAGGLLAFVLLQSRAAYVFVILTIVAMSMIGGQSRQLWAFLAVIALSATALLTIELSGLELKGRVGKLGLTSITEHVMSLSGKVSHDSEFKGAAGGIDQRKGWRTYSLNLWGRDFGTRAFGIGFGRPLTDLRLPDKEGRLVAVPDPHNSYITSLTRFGLVGFTLWISLMGWMVYMSVIGYRRYRDRHRPTAGFFLAMLPFLIYTAVDAWGEPHFEVSYYIIPTYYLLGTSWAIWQYAEARFGSLPRKRRY